MVHRRDKRKRGSPSSPSTASDPRAPPTSEQGGPEFVVAIPSYQRVEVLKRTTLALLQRHKVPPEQVFIFVANEQELAAYSAALGSAWPNMIVGVKGLWQQRNFITDFFREGTHVVSLDDDIEDVRELVHKHAVEEEDGDEEPGQEGEEDEDGEEHGREGEDEDGAGAEDREEDGEDDGGPPLEPLWKGELPKLFACAKEMMVANNAFLWSVNTSDNCRHMERNKHSLSNGLCNGFFWGCLLRKDVDLRLETGDGAEDVERSARYFNKDGAVLRYRNICAITRCGRTKGGLQSSLANRSEAALKACATLAMKFPHLLRVSSGKVNVQFLTVSPRARLEQKRRINPLALAAMDARGLIPLLSGAVWAHTGTDGEIDAAGRVLNVVPPSAGARESCLHLLARHKDETRVLKMTLGIFLQLLKFGEMHLLWFSQPACDRLGITYHELDRATEGLLFPFGEPAVQHLLSQAPGC